MPLPRKIGTGRALLSGRRAITYLLNDEFLTNASAPLGTNTAEPGPGSEVFTDAGSIISKSGGEMVANGTASGNTGFLNSATADRVAGRITAFFFAAITAAGLGRVGLNSTTLTSSFIHHVLLGSGIFTVNDSGAYQPAFVPPATLIFIERATGCFVCIGTRLIWVFRTSTSSVKPSLWFANAQAPNLRLGSVKVTTVAALAAEANLYTANSASPVSGDTFTMAADAIIDFNWTVVAAETLIIMFRRTDDNDTLKLVCDQAAGTVKMYKTVAGVDTELTGGTTTQTWTATTTYRVTVITQGTALVACVDGTRKNLPAAQTAQQNATGGKVSGFATGANLIAWRSDLSALIPAELVPT